MWHDDEITCHLADRKWRSSDRRQRSGAWIKRETRDFFRHDADVYEFIHGGQADRGWLGDVSQLDRRPGDRCQIACSTDLERGQAVPSGISDEYKFPARINGHWVGLITGSEWRSVSSDNTDTLLVP